MKWMKYTIITTEEACDLVCSMLNDLGITSLEIEDKAPVSPEENGGYFGDVVPDPVYDDHKARVTFYMEVPEEESEEDADREEELLRNVGQGLMDISRFADIGEARIEIGMTAEEDWVNNWKQYFHQFTVDDIRIIPSWEEVPALGDEELILRIDPGTAFGTGKHESTQLAIRGIRKYIEPGMRVLDIGTGSGILSVIGMKLGAGKAIGTDIDPIAVRVAGENAKANGLSVFAGTVSEVPDGSVAFYTGNMLDDEAFCVPFSEQKYPIVVANILADVIIPLAPVVRRFLLPGGVFVCSGIINLMEEKTKKAFTDLGYEILNEERMNDWVSYAVRLPG